MLTAHDWYTFASPIFPLGGPMAEVRTLREAARLILALGQRSQRDPVWIATARLLLDAVMTRRAEDVELARVQLIEALEDEGWLGASDVTSARQRQSARLLPGDAAEPMMDIGLAGA